MRQQSSLPPPEELDAFGYFRTGDGRLFRRKPTWRWSTPTDSPMNLSVRRYSRETLLALIIAVLVLAVGVRAPVFLSPESLNGVLTDTAILAMMALAQMVVILTRGIDLSVAANLALSGMVVALLSEQMPDLPILVTILVATGVGSLLGFINGFLVATVAIPPIVVTLGTLAVYRGLVFVVSGGRWISSDKMAPTFLAFPHKTLLGLSSLVWIAALVAVLMAVFLGRTRVGRGLYAVGGNPVAARYCGVDSVRQELLVFHFVGRGLGFVWLSLGRPLRHRVYGDRVRI